MKYKISVGLLVLLFHQATSQTYDSSYHSTYYEQKVTLFRSLPDTKGEIIFLGNSITDIGEWAELWQNINVKNRGISGDISFGVLARLDEVLASKPEKIFIMIGINDIARNIPDSVILSNYKKIITRIQKESPKTKLYIQSILPTNNEFTQFKNHQNKDEHIRFVNAELVKLCELYGVYFINLYHYFLNNQEKLDKQYTNDGLHLNGAGYLLWRKILKQEGVM